MKDPRKSYALCAPIGSPLNRPAANENTNVRQERSGNLQSTAVEADHDSDCSLVGVVLVLTLDDRSHVVLIWILDPTLPCLILARERL